MAASKKTYYPPKTFDDDLDGLVRLYESKSWIFSGVDLEQLKLDVEQQRQQRAEHDALEGQYLSLHEQFGIEQEERHKRFQSALNAARGSFRADKTVMVELDRFKRSARRSKKREE